MSFSRAQQPAYRALSAAAWQCHCRRHSLDPSDDDAGRAWYEDQLEAATGQRSTKLCTPTRGYEQAMARFEAVVGESIEWQLKAETGDDRRVMHEVHKRAPRFDCQSVYLRAIAQQALGLDHLPAWSEIPEAARPIVIRAIVKQHRRQELAHVPTDHPRPTREENPF